MIVAALFAALVATCFAAAFASRNATFARRLDAAATMSAKSIGYVFGAVLAIAILAIHLSTTPLGRILWTVTNSH